MTSGFHKKITIPILNIRVILSLDNKFRCEYDEDNDILIKVKGADHMKTVSVIIPVKNNALALSHLLTDLKKQTYAKIEVILIDNNSFDRSYHQMVAFKKLSGRPTTIIQNRMKQNQYHSYNQGIEQAHGDLIMFLTANQRLFPQYIDKLVTKKETEHVAVAGYRSANQTHIQKDNLLPLFLQNQLPSSVHNLLIDTNLIKESRFLPNLNHASQLEFLAQLYQKINRVVFLYHDHPMNTVPDALNMLQAIQIIEANIDSVKYESYLWQFKHAKLVNVYQLLHHLPQRHKFLFQAELKVVKQELSALEKNCLSFSSSKRMKSWINRRFNLSFTVYPELQVAE